MKKCPFCAELIQDEAIKCRYCGSMLTSGATPSPSDAVWQMDVRNLSLQGQKIDAIKLVRQHTGCGLKDAKDFVEAIERGQTPPVPPAAAAPASSLGCTILFAAIALGIAGALIAFFLRH